MLDASPLHGTLALAVDGSFSYTPGTDYVGADTFTYHASDGALDSNTATVTITVGADNDPPTAVADAYTTDEDVQLGVAAPGVLDNDSDPEGDTLMAVLDAGPAHGALTLNMDGAFSYTPELDYTGEDTFTYHASDGSLDSAAAMVTIQVNAVNDAPQAKDDSYTTNDDTPLNVIAPGVLFNDNDPENDALSAVLYTSTGYGELILNADGSFSYTPDPGYVGDDTFSYRASDGSLESAAATVTIHVGVANDSPQAVADSYSTDQDAELNISAPGLLANDSDPNGDNLMAFLDTAPLNGSLVLNANGSFSYTPSLGFTGEDTFSYHASDGSLSSEVVSVTIVVEATGYCLYLPVVKKP
jgi:VCBS repeat-containing protein